MQPITPHECSRIAQDLQIRKVQVESTVQLLDEGNTVPFITRYRKERTGGLNEEIIRQIQVRISFLRSLHDRKQTILKTIQTQGKLTDELREAILKADTTKRLEDLYLPYKPKKRSLATAAREKGLEPLALAIWHGDPAADNIEEILPGLVNPEKQLAGVDDVRQGVQHILAEMTAESAPVRAAVRHVLWETGKVTSTKNEKLQEGQGLEYKDYFQFNEPARHIPAHRILALNRGEKEGAIKVKLEYDTAAVAGRAVGALAEHLLGQFGKTPAVQPVEATPPPPPTPEMQATAEGQQAPTGAESAQQPAEQPATPPVEGAAAAPAEAAPAVPPEAVSAPPDTTASPTEPRALPPEAVPSEAVPPEAVPPVPEATPPVAEIGLPPKPPLEMRGDPLVGDVPYRTPHAELFKKVLEDALQRLLLPSLEREIRNELTDEAEGHAAAVFARNLRSLLLQPPLHGRRILAIDPGFRTGCKLAVLDEYGNLLDHAVIHPFAPLKKGREKKEKEAAAAPVAAPPPPAAAPEAPPAPDQAPTAEQPATDITPTAAPEAAPPAPEAASAEAQAAPAETPSPETAPAAEQTTPPPAEAQPPEAAAPEPPPPPPDRRAESKGRLVDLIKKHNAQVVALGNGTGCRETEEIVAEVIAADTPDLSYVIVNEAGASVYSVSPVGREEFPELDSVTRSTVSIGRRLQDPLAELVKVEPQHIGVGLYQHDLGRKELKESLDAVVESCVNQVGVNVNTASIPLLRHVSGLNQMVARELVEYRKQHGPFQSRDALMQVPGMGQQRFVQAAGFLKIPQGPNPLDQTWIHPESYPVAQQILSEVGAAPTALTEKPALDELQGKLRTLNADDVAKRLNVGVPTVYDILHALARPGLDPREELPPPIFKKGILKVEDLQSGMELKGTVLNVVDFGAFVDIGLKDSGLVHISQMANRYIKSPYDVVAVNDVVTVWVLAVDKERNRVSLTMIKPGTERRPPERRPQAPRGERAEGGRPPRGRGRGGPRPQPQGAGPGQGGPPPAGPQGQGGHGGRPPRGRQGGGPGRGPRPGGPQVATPGGEGPRGDRPADAGQARPENRPPQPPPRRPRREPPRPKLTQEKLEGKAPLRTFGELSALFAAKKEPPAPPKSPPAAETPPHAEGPASPPPEPPPTPPTSEPEQPAPEQTPPAQS